VERPKPGRIATEGRFAKSSNTRRFTPSSASPGAADRHVEKLLTNPFHPVRETPSARLAASLTREVLVRITTTDAGRDAEQEPAAFARGRGAAGVEAIQTVVSSRAGARRGRAIGRAAPARRGSAEASRVV
jgi:hypothetical protein